LYAWTNFPNVETHGNCSIESKIKQTGIQNSGTLDQFPRLRHLQSQNSKPAKLNLARKSEQAQAKHSTGEKLLDPTTKVVFIK